MNIRIRLTRPGATAPRYMTAGAAGADLCMWAAGDHVTTWPGERILLATGVALELPPGHVALVLPRSGLARQGLVVTPGVIDSDYRGEIGVQLHNQSQVKVTLSPGDRIANLVIIPCVRADFQEADELSETQRGAGGFGHTGSR